MPRLVPSLLTLALLTAPVLGHGELQQSFDGRVDSLATASDWIAAGDALHDGTFSHEGRIVLYHHDGRAWQPAGELFAPTPAISDDETFGTPLVMDGEWLATVSARPGGHRVFVFRLVGGTWTFFDELRPVDPGGSWSLNGLVRSLDIDGSRLALGMPRASNPRDPNGALLPADEQSNFGGVVLYEFDGDAWVQTAFLERRGRIGGNGSCCGDQLGWDVGLNGDFVFAGTLHQPNPFPFFFNGTGWVEEDPPIPPDGLSTGLGISDADWWVQQGVFACPPPTGSCFSAELFEREGDTWVWRQKLRNPVDELQRFLVGSLRGGRLLVRAREDDGQSDLEGAIYEYGLQAGHWQLVDALRADPPVTNEQLGSKVVQGPGFVAAEAILKLYLFGAPLHPLGKDEVKCVTGVHRAFAKLAATRRKALQKCLKTRASKGGAVDDCMDAASAKLAKAEDKTRAVEAKRCLAPPPFGSNGAEMANGAALQGDALLRDLFGDDLDAGIAAGSSKDPRTRCQLAVVRDLDRCQATWLKNFGSCAKRGLARSEIANAPGLDPCLEGDPSGKVAKACDAELAGWRTKTIPKTCAHIDLIDAFPPCSSDDAAELSQCLADAAACRVCLAVNEATGIAAPCTTCRDEAP